MQIGLVGQSRGGGDIQDGHVVALNVGNDPGLLDTLHEAIVNGLQGCVFALKGIVVRSLVTDRQQLLTPLLDPLFQGGLFPFGGLKGNLDAFGDGAGFLLDLTVDGFDLTAQLFHFRIFGQIDLQIELVLVLELRAASLEPLDHLILEEFLAHTAPGIAHGSVFGLGLKQPLFGFEQH